MIIEFIGNLEIILLHYNDSKDRLDAITATKEELEKATKFDVVLVPNGKPCINNRVPKISIFRGSNKDLFEAIKAICKGGGVDKYVPLSDEQYIALARAKTDGELYEV